MQQYNKIVHLDCTLRDGGYYTKWDFSKDLMEDYLVAVKAAEIDVAEIGFRFWSNNGFRGACAYTTDDFLETLNIPDGLSIGIMMNAAEIITDKILNLERLEKLMPRLAKDSPVDLVRIASHVHEMEPVLEACKWLNEKGYITSANIMQISEHSEQKIEEIAAKASNYPVDVLYFADSLGNITPDDVTKITNAIRKHWDGPIGIHAHDNLMLAFANSTQALDSGAEWVDSTITGMGRGPGNLRTEEFVLEMAKTKAKPYDLLPLLKLVRTIFNPLKSEYGWGSNPFYYMAGLYSIHPTYIQEMLKDNQYDDEDILSVVNHLKNTNSAKFDCTALNAAMNFYSGPPRGSWAPCGALKDNTILLLGVGPSIEQHKEAIETYIKREKPTVLALNTLKHIDSDLINYRVACHPVRLLADVKKHLKFPAPLITPLSMLPESLQNVLKDKNVCDFGIEIQPERFEFNDTSCVTPTSNVMAYALSVIRCGRSKEILLAGFDGYVMGSARNDEMNKIFHLFKEQADIPLCSVTPTVYKIPQQSIYAI